MGREISLALNPSYAIEIDSALVARAFGIEVIEFQQLLDTRKISTLCERGTEEDSGLFRASFYHRDTRVRLVVNGEGQLQGEPETRCKSA